MAEEKNKQDEKKITDKKTNEVSKAQKEQVEVKETAKKDAEKKIESPKEEESNKPQTATEEKKKEIPKAPKKEEAVAYGMNLHASKKHCMYICSFIKNKKVDDSIRDLERVIMIKKAIPFKGEVPHRKGDMMSGRYPVKASKLFIQLLKGLRGNIIQNGMDLDKTRIYIASASWASRPLRSGGREGKRTNVILKAKEVGGKK